MGDLDPTVIAVILFPVAGSGGMFVAAYDSRAMRKSMKTIDFLAAFFISGIFGVSMFAGMYWYWKCEIVWLGFCVGSLSGLLGPSRILATVTWARNFALAVVTAYADRRKRDD